LADFDLRGGAARRKPPPRSRVSGRNAELDSLVVDRQYDQPVQQYDLSTLPTGERVISEYVPSVRSVSLGFWIGTGSRDETDSRAGVSHFIEHLLFKGTGTHTAQEIAEIFDGLGGELNAATSRETTLVYARVPDDRLEAALDVIVGMVYDPAFAEVDAEREVVLEEIAMVDDNPQDLVHDIVAEAVFGSHPLGRPVIGRAEVISSVSARALAAYHRAVYAHDNIVVAAAGNVTHERVLELLAARIPKTQNPARRTRKPFGRVPSPGYRFQRKTTEQYHVCLGAPGISRRDDRRFAASLLDSILGGSASSRLFQEIREKRGMAYSVYSFASQYSDSGQLGLYVGTREENLVECLEIVARELGDVSAGNVRPGELERAKENLKGRMLLSMESTSNRMSRLGKSLITDSELLDLDEIVERVEAVTSDDVAAVAGDLLRLDRLSAAGIGPSEARFKAAVQRVNPALVGRKAA
jgi:predicted Zn-dependent peptidase